MSPGRLATMTTPPGDQPPPGGWQQPPPGGWQQPPQYPPYNPYGAPGYPPAPPSHPKAVTALVLGTLGIITCQILSPFAWSIGKKTVEEIDASNGQLGGRGQAQAGYVLGVVGTILLGLGLLFLLGMGLLLLVFGVAGVAQTGT